MFSTVVSSGGLGLRMMSLMLRIMPLPNGRKNAASVSGVGASRLSSFFSFNFFWIQPHVVFCFMMCHWWGVLWRHHVLRQQYVVSQKSGLSAAEDTRGTVCPAISGVFCGMV